MLKMTADVLSKKVDPKQIMAEANKFAREHVVQLSRDLLYLKDNGILPDKPCKFEELRTILIPITNSYSGLAESLVQTEAMKYVVAKNEPFGS